MKLALSSRSRTSLAAIALLPIMAVSIGEAEALPIVPQAALAAAVETGAPTIEKVQYLHRRYPGANSRRARMRRSKQLAPNRFCDKQPSRCR